jgi:hypothetical protein
MADFQRSTFYRWEDWTSDAMLPEYDNDLTFEDCVSLIERVSQKHGIKCPEVVRANKKRKRSCYFPGEHSIHLTTDGCSIGVALHEVTHAITESTGENDGHGPRFVKNYCEIMSRMFQIDKKKLLDSAKQWGLKIAV